MKGIHNCCPDDKDDQNASSDFKKIYSLIGFMNGYLLEQNEKKDKRKRKEVKENE